MVEACEAVEFSRHNMSVLPLLFNSLDGCGIPKTILRPNFFDCLLSRQLFHQRLDGLKTSVERTRIYSVNWRLYCQDMICQFFCLLFAIACEGWVGWNSCWTSNVASVHAGFWIDNPI